MTKRIARIRVLVTGVYDIDVGVKRSDIVEWEDDVDPVELEWQAQAVYEAHEKQTLWIKEHGNLINITSDGATFMQWVEEE